MIIDWGQVAFIVNTGQALASIPSDHQSSTQLSLVPRDHKIIWGNQHCTAILLSYRSFMRAILFQWFPSPLCPFEIPVLACSSLGLHTQVSQQWIFCLNTYFFLNFLWSVLPKIVTWFSKNHYMSIFPSEINDDPERVWKAILAQLQIKCIHIFDINAYYSENQASINLESIKARTAQGQIIKTTF